MNELAQLAIARADALVAMDNCDRRDAQHPLLEMKYKEADREFRSVLIGLPDQRVREEVDAAIKALLERG